MHLPPGLAALLRPELALIQAYAPHAAAPGVLRLDANESPYGPPTEWLSEVLARAGEEVAFNRYPDPSCRSLREAISARQGCHPDEVVVGNGTDEVIAMILCALSRPRDGAARATTLFPWPSFVMYRLSALAQGVEPVAVDLDEGWDLDVPAMLAAFQRARPNTVFLPSPNNPTGNCYSDLRIGALLESCDDALILLDEAYGAFAERGYDHLRRAHGHVGQLQTLSKVGFAAIRCGWAILPRAVAAEVNKVRQPYNLDALTQRIAREVIEGAHQWIDETARRVRASRDALAAALSAIDGVTVSASDSNFLWVQVDDAAATHARLLARGVLVRSFHSQGGRMRQRLRVTVGTDHENATLIEALRALS